MSRRGDHLDFTLEHMFPALLAEAQGVGGDGLMFATVPLLGGARAARVLSVRARVLRHPLAALGAMLCLGLLMPQVSFSRDSTTEIPMQVLLFSAVWMLCDRRTLRHRGTAFTAGLFLGLLQAIHIDGLAFIMGLPFVGLVLAPHRTSTTAAVAAALLFAGVGVAIGVALGFFDLVHRSQLYFHTIRTDHVRLASAWCSRRRARPVRRILATVVVAAHRAAPVVAAGTAPGRASLRSAVVAGRRSSGRGSFDRRSRPCAARRTSW